MTDDVRRVLERLDLKVVGWQVFGDALMRRRRAAEARDDATLIRLYDGVLEELRWRSVAQRPTDVAIDRSAVL